MQIEKQQWDELLFACYQGGLQQPLWQDFLQQLKDLFVAQYVTLMLRPPKEGDEGVVLNAIQPYIDTYYSYKAHFFAQDPFVNLPLGKALTLDDVVDMQQFKQTAYYLDYLSRTKTEYVLGLDLVDENGFSARLRLTRSAEQENFGDNEKEELQQLARHLTQSIVLYSRMANAQSYLETYQTALDSMAMGCILLDEKLQVVAKNKTAEAFLQDRSVLKIKNKILSVGNVREQKKFRDLFKAMHGEMLKTQQAVVNTFRLDSASSMAGIGLLCRVLPPSMTPDAGPNLALFIADPDKPRLSDENLLAQLFGLTRAEARLALLLANGESLDQAAESLGVTRNTAKSHLGSTFTKIGVTRQPHLVQIILRSVASLT